MEEGHGEILSEAFTDLDFEILQFEEQVRTGTSKANPPVQTVEDEALSQQTLIRQTSAYWNRGPCSDILDFPVRDLVQSLEDLVSEDDPVEGAADKVKDFTGDDHQEAGETFAEFPLDFSLWGDDEATDEEHKCKLDAQLSALREMSYLDRETEPTLLGTVNIDNKEDQDVCPRWTEIVDAKHRAFTAGETDNKYKSKTHPYAPRTVLAERSWTDVGDEVGACLEEEDHTQDEEELNGATNATCSSSDKDLHHFYDYTCASESIFDIGPQAIHIFSSSTKADGEYKRDHLSLHGSAPAIGPLQEHHDEMGNIYEDSSLTKICTTLVEAPAGSEGYVSANMPLFSEDSTLKTEDDDKQKVLPSLEAAQSAKVVSKDPFNTDAQGDIHLISLSSSQGSVDDGFFFSHEHEASGIAELDYFGDDEYEEERNWKQKQERIQAFNEFYNDSNGEIDQEGRKTKVHFCTDLLSQVIHYDSEED